MEVSSLNRELNLLYRYEMLINEPKLDFFPQSIAFTLMHQDVDPSTIFMFCYSRNTLELQFISF